MKTSAVAAVGTVVALHGLRLEAYADDEYGYYEPPSQPYRFKVEAYTQVDPYDPPEYLSSNGPLPEGLALALFGQWGQPPPIYFQNPVPTSDFWSVWYNATKDEFIGAHTTAVPTLTMGVSAFGNAGLYDSGDDIRVMGFYNPVQSQWYFVGRRSPTAPEWTRRLDLILSGPQVALDTNAGDYPGIGGVVVKRLVPLWNQIAFTGPDANDWNDSTAYVQGDIVRHQGAYYQLIVPGPITGRTPIAANAWAPAPGSNVLDANNNPANPLDAFYDWEAAVEGYAFAPMDFWVDRESGLLTITPSFAPTGSNLKVFYAGVGLGAEVPLPILPELPLPPPPDEVWPAVPPPSLTTGFWTVFRNVSKGLYLSAATPGLPSWRDAIAPVEAESEYEPGDLVEIVGTYDVLTQGWKYQNPADSAAVDGFSDTPAAVPTPTTPHEFRLKQCSKPIAYATTPRNGEGAEAFLAATHGKMEWPRGKWFFDNLPNDLQAYRDKVKEINVLLRKKALSSEETESLAELRDVIHKMEIGPLEDPSELFLPREDDRSSLNTHAILFSPKHLEQLYKQATKGFYEFRPIQGIGHPHWQANNGHSRQGDIVNLSVDQTGKRRVTIRTYQSGGNHTDISTDLDNLIPAHRAEIEQSWAKRMELVNAGNPVCNVAINDRYYKKLWITCIENCNRPSRDEQNYLLQNYEIEVADGTGKLNLITIGTHVYSRKNRVQTDGSNNGLAGGAAGVILRNWVHPDRGYKELWLSVFGYGAWVSGDSSDRITADFAGAGASLGVGQVSVGSKLRKILSLGVITPSRRIKDPQDYLGEVDLQKGLLEPPKNAMAASSNLTGPGEFDYFSGCLTEQDQSKIPDAEHRGNTGTINHYASKDFPEVIWRHEAQNKWIEPTDHFRLHAPKFVTAMVSMRFESSNNYAQNQLAETSEFWWPAPPPP